jgi:hypothetical protein
MAAASSILLGIGAISLAAAYQQSETMKAQGDFQRQQFETNARLAEMQAQDTIKRGDEDAAAYKKQVKQVIGSQRAAMAAQGIELDSGSALDIQEETAGIGALDALTIKNNAWREAWGYRMQASSMAGQGAMAQIGARNDARNTMLTGGMNAANFYVRGLASYSPSQSPSPKAAAAPKPKAG